jgi:hypothetical protein
MYRHMAAKYRISARNGRYFDNLRISSLPQAAPFLPVLSRIVDGGQNEQWGLMHSLSERTPTRRQELFKR